MAHETPGRLRVAELRKLAAEAEGFSANENCVCRMRHAGGWESISDERWPVDLMELQGTLRDEELQEPTFEEFHPAGTRYDSPDAPVAVDFFPFNRCNVYRCVVCKLVVLRYTEYGGYYVDHRARCVKASLIVD
ncbi:hypothetical protein [Variovorax sp. AFSI2.2]|uniref:hypothetical protein n=1 Tax=Variovorax sp. AFSI2.2 TaxID=3384160 RepID=UPI003EBDCA68